MSTVSVGIRTITLHFSGVNFIAIALLCSAQTFMAQLKAEDAEAVERRVLAAIDAVESYPSVKLKGRLESGRKLILTLVSLEVRGDEIWQEYESFSADEPRAEVEKKRDVMRKISGCDLPRIAAFDGKTNYTFDPYNLFLTTRPSQNFRGGGFNIASMLPTNWVAMTAGGTSHFRRFVENKSVPVLVEQLPDGQWKLSQKDMDHRLPPELRDKIGIRDRHIIVDPKSNYLVTEYEGSGGLRGDLSGQLEWAEQDGFWYLKHAKHMRGKETECEWFIDEISFDAKDCRKRFENLESLVPYATMIHEYDGNMKLVTERYKGGEPGKEEHKLRTLALRKYQRTQ